MAKVITFSRTFPNYHPRAGHPTYFVEQFWNSIFEFHLPKEIQNKPASLKMLELNHPIILSKIGLELYSSLSEDIETKKHHTIRAGKRFKKGDFFSPRVWGNDINPKSGKSGPYHSKQIILAPDTEILEVWDILISKSGAIYINGSMTNIDIEIIAKNDGLNRTDFENWFSKLPFSGQIICWNENVKY